MIENQANLFLIFVINGILIGLLFDIFRILRKSFKTADIVTYIEDILFWVLTGAIILYSIFVFNNGEIRLFMFLGIILGGAFYLLLFSKYIIKISVNIINTFKRIIKLICGILSYPIKLIYKLISKPIKVVVINLKKIFRQKEQKTKEKIPQIYKNIKNNLKSFKNIKGKKIKK